MRNITAEEILHGLEQTNAAVLRQFYFAADA